MAARSSELTAAVANAISEARRSRGMSMDELASRAGVHRTSVGLIERGRRGLTIDVAARLTEALGLSLGDVIKEVERQSE